MVFFFFEELKEKKSCQKRNGVLLKNSKKSCQKRNGAEEFKEKKRNGAVLLPLFFCLFQEPLFFCLFQEPLFFCRRIQRKEKKRRPGFVSRKRRNTKVLLVQEDQKKDQKKEKTKRRTRRRRRLEIRDQKKDKNKKKTRFCFTTNN